MLKRKIMQTLLDWKTNKNKECLLIKGARQIGKTYIVELFAKENYKNYIYINFEESPRMRDIFNGDISAEEIVKRMSLVIPGVIFIEGETLIFLDEIQACPQARTALKFLAIDNRYDIIASGSLLGINYKEVESIPVGYETQVEMHSLDFEEFLWAIGIDDTAIGYLKEYFNKVEAIPSSMHVAMMKYLREYIVVGGMPAVVNKFVETSNFNLVQVEQQKIIDSYLDDITKYASLHEKPKTKNCYLSIPRQLTKEYKKFQFSTVERGATSRKYGNSLEWLRDANLVKFCFNVSTPVFPLSAYEREDQYKIYMGDIGILISMYGFDMKKAIIDDTLVGNAKGGIYENLIADIFIKKGYKLYYYKNDNSTQEIEFLISINGSIIPIEVKSGNGTTISLNEILKRPDIKFGYKLMSGNVGRVEKKIVYPLYFAMFM